MNKKRRLPFTEIPRHVTGFSTPVFGISWTPPESNRKIVRRLMAFLEDRRALYADYHMEYGPWIEESVLEMREELTEVLKFCPEQEELTEPIRAMRAACRKFLDEMGHPGTRRAYYAHEVNMWQALGAMRAILRLKLARLCTAFGIDVEPELASIFPSVDDESES